jgi:magnesium chelatase family protein
VDLAAQIDRPPPPPLPALGEALLAGVPDMAEVRGQVLARRALEIAAAGGHNLLLAGPPGSGKTMLARRLPGILPPLSPEEALEVTAIHSAWGAAVDRLIDHRPFRAPHHTISDAAMVGGGALPRPGEISLAHNGVLFLDELPEFGRRVLEALRQPLEEHRVTVSRVRGSLTLPARFQLVAAMNPCPCGGGACGTACRCTPTQLLRYQQRISGPLLDRMDLRVTVPPVPYAELAGPGGEASGAVASRVAAARRLQALRNPGGRANAALEGAEVRALDREAGVSRLLERAVTLLHLSGRAHDRLLRVARTLADLSGDEVIAAPHMAEALQFRGVEAPTTS